MRTKFSERFRDITAACLLSGLIAGAIVVLTSPVTAENAVAVATTVNRIAKGDRLPLAHVALPARKNSNSIEAPASRRALLGCEPAFSPFASSVRANIFTHCAA